MICLHTRLPFSKSFAWTTQFRSAQKGLLHKAPPNAGIEVNGVQDLFVVNMVFVFYQQCTSISNQVEKWNSQIEKVNMFPITKSTFYVCSFIILIQIY
jgi:hypothetical protein